MLDQFQDNVCEQLIDAMTTHLLDTYELNQIIERGAGELDTSLKAYQMYLVRSSSQDTLQGDYTYRIQMLFTEHAKHTSINQMTSRLIMAINQYIQQDTADLGIVRFINSNSNFFFETMIFEYEFTVSQNNTVSN